MVIYVVKKGDTVSSIAAAYGVEADTIIYDNQLPSPYALTVGQALLLSAAESFLPDTIIKISSSNLAPP